MLENRKSVDTWLHICNESKFIMNPFKITKINFELIKKLHAITNSQEPVDKD